MPPLPVDRQLASSSPRLLPHGPALLWSCRIEHWQPSIPELLVVMPFLDNDRLAMACPVIYQHKR
jgi:hypothetical protein